jgi:glycolate oxidase iron-sulfur subunit
MARTRPLPVVARVVLYIFARPVLLRTAMALSRALRATGIPRMLGRGRGRIAFNFAMLASTARNNRRRKRPVTASGTQRGTVAVLTGCVMEGLFAPVNRATEHLLARQGFSLVPVRGQRCCGALHAHAGDDGTARDLARANIAAFERSGADLIAVNSAGCGAMLKEYGYLLQDDVAWAERARAVSARVRDISELLVPAGAADPAQGRMRVAYDAPCHLMHAQRVVAPPLALLASQPHIEMVPLPGADQCCGSAGIFNLIDPGVAAAVLAPKLAAIGSSGAEVVATGNPGCLMQIGAGLLSRDSRVVARHPVELIDEAP